MEEILVLIEGANIVTDSPQYARETVADKLRRVAAGLPAPLVVFEGWRSLEKQTAQFKKQRAIFRAQLPQLGEDELDEYTHNFVAMPTRAVHITGGAVDVAIAGLDFGTAYCEMTERARTDYFDGVQEEFAKNRLLLKAAMAGEGFVNFPYEWWHFEYGIDTWCAVNGAKAMYGPVSM